MKHFITFLRFACQFFGFCLSNINNSEERLNFAEYIKGNLSLFLSGDADKEQNKKVIENILKGEKYSTAQLSSLSSMYNDADEKIGTKVQYILVELNV